jgi:large subunit ribosomal protein L10
MPLSRQQKEEMVASYREGLATAPHAFLLFYKGITVPQVTALRSKVRDNGGEYLVVKNTLALRAIEGGPLEQLKELFEGPVAVVFSQTDAVGLAKALSQAAKEIPVLELRGGVVDGQVVQANQVADIANLPSREELIAKLLFLLQSPIVRLARVLAALPQQLVIVLDQVRQQKDESAGA